VNASNAAPDCISANDDFEFLVVAEMKNRLWKQAVFPRRIILFHRGFIGKTVQEGAKVF
jgi:hypothetical protein